MLELKILQVIPVFYPALAFGGPVNVVYNLCRELAKRGHEVSVYTTNAFDQKRNFKPEHGERTFNGFKVRYFKNVLRPNKLYISPGIVPALQKEIDDFDIIHLHTWRQFQEIVTTFFSKTHNIPYVLHAHGTLPWKRMNKQVLKAIYNQFFGYRILRSAAKVFALSSIEAGQYKDMGVAEEKIATIPNGIDLFSYTQLPPKESFKKKFSIDEDEKIVLYLGRIDKMKGIDFLIKSFSRLIKNCTENLKLVIAGPDTGYLKDATSLVASLGLNNKVLFTGLISEKDKISAYVDSTIVAYLNPYEPFGLVPLESAACETPVIVADGTSMSEIVNQGGFGFHVKYGDTMALSKLMGKLIENTGLAVDMGKKGHEFVFKNFGWESITRKIEQVYSSVAYPI